MSVSKGVPSVRFAWTSILCLLITTPGGAQTLTARNVADILGFENGQAGAAPAGWSVSPANTIFIDDKVFHGGKYSARIERADRKSVV